MPAASHERIAIITCRGYDVEIGIFGCFQTSDFKFQAEGSMTFSSKTIFTALAAAVMGVSMVSAQTASAPATTATAPATTTTAPATTKAARTSRAITRDLKNTQDEIADLLPSIKDMLDKEKRAKVAGEAVPL